MNGKYYNNPTFPDANENAFEEEVEKKETDYRHCQIYVTFPESNLWHDVVFEGRIIKEENNLLTVKKVDSTILLPTKYINYVEYNK